MATPAADRAALQADSRCELGECPLWCAREGVLWWTDIESSKLWRLRPADGELRSWALPDRLGSFALCTSGRLLLGLSKGLYLAEAPGADAALRLTLMVAVETPRDRLRINDGRTDRAGNFVFGTLNEDPQREALGSFYQYSLRHGLRRLDLGGVAIPNSIAFSPDGERMYFCDSTRGKILRCRYDADSATVSEIETFAEVAAPACPDGATVDRDGRLWSAQWGAGRVVCYGIDGSIEEIVEVPATHVTCLAFGGDGLDELFITSARVELASDQLLAEPHAGGVFRARPTSSAGLPDTRFGDR